MIFGRDEFDCIKWISLSVLASYFDCMNMGLTKYRSHLQLWAVVCRYVLKRYGSSPTAPILYYYLGFCVLLTLFLDRFGFVEDDLVILFVHIHLDGRTILISAAQ